MHNKLLYWMSLLILVIANFLVSIFLIPFLLILNPLTLYFIVIAVGLIVGLIFTHLIRDIESLEKKHHIFAGIFIPLVGVIDLFIVIDVSNTLSDVLRLPNHQDPFAASLVFVSSFLFPYVVSAGGKRII